MVKKYDAIVIGGGVMGGSTAFQLSKKGYKVLVLEKDQLGGKASSAAAGMIGAQVELDPDSPMFHLACKSRKQFPELAVEIKDLTGIDIGFRKNGMLKIAFSNEERGKFLKIIESQQHLGEQVDWLTPEEVIKKEPLLSSSCNGAMYIEGGGQVSAPDFTMGLLKAAAALGTDSREYCEVKGFLREGNRVIGVSTNEGDFYSHSVVVTAGAWTTQLIQGSGLDLKGYPVKGESFSVLTNKPLLTHTIFSSSCYIVPKTSGRLIIGATVKPYSFSRSVSVEGITQLMEDAKFILPAIKEAEWEEAWAGTRPQSLDGLPYLGEHPEWSHLFIANGHFRNGILLSPITGMIMTDLIEGKKTITDVESFRIDRLTRQVK